jgi:hypothetical protein
MLVRMVRRLASTIFVCLGWLACVGDDPVSPLDAGTGDRLGPCFSDGKCKEGLECHPTEKVCVARDEPVVDGGGGGDTTPADSSSDAAEAGVTDAATPPCELSVDPGVRCPAVTCTGVTSCCIDLDGNHTCANSCASGTKRYECDSKSVCGGGTRCCANVASERPGVACNKQVTLTFSYCETGSCPGTTRPTCRTAAECTAPGAQCVLKEVELVTDVVAVWGFCE